MSFNELIVDSYDDITLSSTADGEILARITQIESPKLDITSEADTIQDALGSTITDLYKSKKAVFTASNSLFSIDLAALQLGAEKEVGSATNKIVVPTHEILEVKEDKITLKNTPVGVIKYVYKLVNKGMAEKFTLGTGETAEEGKFIIKAKEITLPTGTEGTIYVDYEYESQTSIKITARTDKFPTQVGFKANVLFRDPCDENKVLAGVIIAKKAKLDPSSVSLDHTRGGKHAFTINFNKDYCDEINKDLFSIIIAGD